MFYVKIMGLGSIQFAITSFNNNRNLLSKRDRLKHTLFAKGKSKVEFKSPQATDLQLKAIRERILLENARIRKKRLIAFAVLMVIFVSTCLIIIN